MKPFGEQVYRQAESAEASIDQLKARVATLEQGNVDLQLQIADRHDELEAARAANRELMAQLNCGRDTPAS
ncbi:hypothetical protein [Nonomuraea sp. NPDC049695]|uniref:hypothetical protein n=1 Tax=Nonomuraea sp. NPDC049695 TaxID=3154734 RepID=UPI0034457DC6